MNCCKTEDLTYTAGVSKEPMPLESINDVAGETGRLASEICYMSRRLCEHLFGSEKDVTKNASEPTCLYEELLRTRATLAETAELLVKISGRVGV